MKMKVIRDIDTDKLWISPVQNNGDWNYYYIIRLQYTEEWSEEWSKECGKYNVELHAVSPEAAKDNLESAKQSCGLDGMPDTPEVLAELLLDYGVSARLWSNTGNNLSQLLRECRKQLKILGITFGFAMDRPQNAIGSTGWDFISGNILAGINQ